MYVIFGLCLLWLGSTVTCDSPLYLTPYIEQNRIDEAQRLANVTLQSLPDIGTSYAGLFTVHKQYNSNLFFWYFVAQKNKETAPIIVWLNGGPGVSSTIGLIQENGPFYIDDDLKPHEREYSWHKDHHIIYIDNPVGVGYSFTDDEMGYANNTIDCARNMHLALVQFFKMFPNLKQNDLYIFGESYGGKYAPALGRIIHKKRLIRNLKGIGIANGAMAPIYFRQLRAEYLYQQGFVDNHGKQALLARNAICQMEFENYTIGKSNITSKQLIQLCIGDRNPFPDPRYNKTSLKNLMGYTSPFNVLFSYDPHKQENGNREAFMNLSSTRDAIHVGDIPRLLNESKIQDHLGITMLIPEIESVVYLLYHNVRVLFYNGELDMCVPYIGTVKYLEQLDFPGKELYRTVARNIWYVDEAVAGYWKQAEGLTEVMVVGAGHMVPIDQPKRAYDLIYKFTRNQTIS